MAAISHKQGERLLLNGGSRYIVRSWGAFTVVQMGEGSSCDIQSSRESRMESFNRGGGKGKERDGPQRLTGWWKLYEILFCCDKQNTEKLSEAKRGRMFPRINLRGGLSATALMGKQAKLHVSFLGV